MNIDGAHITLTEPLILPAGSRLADCTIDLVCAFVGDFAVGLADASPPASCIGNEFYCRIPVPRRWWHLRRRYRPDVVDPIRLLSPDSDDADR